MKEIEVEDTVRAFALSLFGDNAINESSISVISRNDQLISTLIGFTNLFLNMTDESECDQIMPGDDFDFFGEVKRNLLLMWRNHLSFYEAYNNFDETIDRFGNELVIYDKVAEEYFCIDIFGNHWIVKNDSKGQTNFVIKKHAVL